MVFNRIINNLFTKKLKVYSKFDCNGKSLFKGKVHVKKSFKVDSISFTENNLSINNCTNLSERIGNIIDISISFKLNSSVSRSKSFISNGKAVDVVFVVVVVATALVVIVSTIVFQI